MNFTPDTVPARVDSLTLPLPLLRILRHSLGLDEQGRGRRYRNHFCTGPGSSDFWACESLVDRDLMSSRVNVGAIAGGDTVYHVTPEGIRVVDLHQPAEPKTTRGQRRYRAFLRFDGGISFIEFLKWREKEIA